MLQKNKQQNIPRDWFQKTLGELLEKMEGGGTPSKENPVFWDGLIPWASVKDVVTHNPFNTQDHISEEGLKNSSSRIVPKGTLIVPTRMALGHAVIFKIDIAINQDLKALYPNKELLNPFLFYWFASKKEYIEKLGSGSTVAGIQQSELKKIRFSLPTISEQKRIVAVLEIWDQAIEKLKRKIEIKKEIKKSLMQSLLSGNVRLNGFTGFWSKHELEDLMRPTSEKYNPISNKEDRMCIELEHLQKKDSVLLGYTSARQQKSIKSVFHAGDVLFGKLRPYLRKFLLPDFLGVCSTEIWVFKTTAKMNNVFAYYLVQTEKFINIASVSSGTHMPRADWGYMRGISFTVPDDVGEQKAIANVIQTQDFEIGILKKKLKYLQDQKKYLLNNLITGTIRTPETLSIPK